MNLRSRLLRGYNKRIRHFPYCPQGSVPSPSLREQGNSTATVYECCLSVFIFVVARESLRILVGLPSRREADGTVGVSVLLATFLAISQVISCPSETLPAGVLAMSAGAEAIVWVRKSSANNLPALKTRRQPLLHVILNFSHGLCSATASWSIR